MWPRWQAVWRPIASTSARSFGWPPPTHCRARRDAGIALGLGAAAAEPVDSPDPDVRQPIEVCGDADALRALVANLLDNAIKYTPAPGQVDVELLRDASQVVLTVDDSGPGIAPAERGRVFDRFFRTSDAQAAGSGLGLAIVKAIADRHGAALALSDSPTLGGLRVELRMASAPVE